ncbi:transcription initiation factor IIB family protein [Halobaculum sp. MBLA0147]|uniref:transcription initiation factor IIB n=1 Tax=Halobaculum sp. MBLA0147 TaxID=3079934 RepID=UPI0035263E87
MHSLSRQDSPAAGLDAAQADTCDECGGTIVQQDGDLLCEECGLLITDTQIDHGPEWRAFSYEKGQSRSRTGPPVTHTYHDNGFSTKIGGDSEKIGGDRPSGHEQLFKRLNKENETEEKFGNGEIIRISTAVGSSDVVTETAAKLFSQFRDQSNLKGRSIEAFATATVWAATRIHDEPLVKSRLNRVARISEQRWMRAYRDLSETLSVGIPPVNPQQLLGQAQEMVGFGIETRQYAESLIAEFPAAKMTGSPRSIVAGAVYLASRLASPTETLTQREVATSMDCSATTVRNWYRKLLASTGRQAKLDREQTTIQVYA